MKRWYELLDPALFHEYGQLHWLAEDNWMPDDAVVVDSPNGSMQMNIISQIIEHFARFGRKNLSRDQNILLLLDGHKSRNDVEWLYEAQMRNIEITQLPINTSHFLQPNDQNVNKTMKRAIREMRTYLSKVQIDLKYNDVSIKMKLGICGFRSLTSEIIRTSYSTIGIWPMDYRFYDWAVKNWTIEPSTRNEGSEVEPDTVFKK